MKKLFVVLCISLLFLTACTKVPITSFADVNGNILGAEDAKVKVEIYSDYACPYCKLAEDSVYELVKEYGNQIRFEFKDFVVHEFAFKASEAANCVSDQGKFWEYHNILFENQDKLDIISLRTYAIDLGVNIEQFNQCLAKNDKKQDILSDIEDGKKLGVQGTPTFVINSKLYPGVQKIDKLKAVITPLLNN